MKWISVLAVVLSAVAAATVGYRTYAQGVPAKLPVNEENMRAGERYRFVATAMIRGDIECQKVPNGMWFDHWCLVVREVEEVK